MSKKQKGIIPTSNGQSFFIKEKYELTEKQKEILDIGMDSKKCRMLILDGKSGVSKTYLAVLIGLTLLQQKKSNLITYIRTSVQPKDGMIGWLAGDICQKTEWMNEPFFSKLDEFLIKPDLDKLIKDGKIKTLPSCQARGLNINGVTVFDEVQNATFSSIETILTRISEHSLLILCGDSSGSQNDLGRDSGFKKIVSIFNDKESVDNGCYYFNLSSEHIVRSKFVKFIVKKLENTK